MLLRSRPDFAKGVKPRVVLFDLRVRCAPLPVPPRARRLAEARGRDNETSEPNHASKARPHIAIDP